MKDILEMGQDDGMVYYDELFVEIYLRFMFSDVNCLLLEKLIDMFRILKQKVNGGIGFVFMCVLYRRGRVGELS